MHSDISLLDIFSTGRITNFVSVPKPAQIGKYRFLLFMPVVLGLQCIVY